MRSDLPVPRVFLLSPAHCGGKRAELLLSGRGRFPLAERLRAAEVTLGEAFSFVSGLYFRGKLTYATHFARPPAGEAPVQVITANRGLLPADTAVSLEDLREFGCVDIRADDLRYRTPLERDLARLAAIPDVELVLLGSVATGKYVDVLLDVVGERLFFPTVFVGRGDMSRGALSLPMSRSRAPSGTERGRGRQGQAMTGRKAASKRLQIPPEKENVQLLLGRRAVQLTNLNRVYWPERGLTN